MGLIQDNSPELVRKAIYQQGGAFRMWHQFANDDGEKYRFFFVLNQSPLDDNIIVVTTTTTKIEKRKRAHRHNPEVLVEITHDEFEPLRQDSLIDCSGAQFLQKQAIDRKIDAGEIKPLQNLSSEKLAEIIHFFSHVKHFTEGQKSLVLGCEDV